MSSQTNPPAPSVPARLVLLSAVTIVLGLLLAGVALGLAGWAPESIAGLLTAVGTVAGALLIMLPKLIAAQERVEQRVEQVAEQTNGALRAHVAEVVRAEVRQALTEYLGDPPAQPRPRGAGRKYPARER